MPKAYFDKNNEIVFGISIEPLKRIKFSFESDNSCELSDKFSEFCDEPFECSLFAQSHKATLKDSGEVVTVKL